MKTFSSLSLSIYHQSCQGLVVAFIKSHKLRPYRSTEIKEEWICEKICYREASPSWFAWRCLAVRRGPSRCMTHMRRLAFLSGESQQSSITHNSLTKAGLKVPLHQCYRAPGSRHFSRLLLRRWACKRKMEWSDLINTVFKMAQKTSIINLKGSIRCLESLHFLSLKRMSPGMIQSRSAMHGWRATDLICTGRIQQTASIV